MAIGILAVWVFQGACMMVDEFYYHRRRGLGKWESWGHPIDSLLFLCCFAWAAVVPYSSTSAIVFFFLAVLSCLIIVKDEFVHTEQCDGGESLLHGLLFQVHPVALLGLYWCWTNDLGQLVLVQAAVIGCFLIYQLLYWNLFRMRKYETRS